MLREVIRKVRDYCYYMFILCLNLIYVFLEKANSFIMKKCLNQVCSLCSEENNQIQLCDLKTVEEILCKYNFGPFQDSCQNFHKRFTLCANHYIKGNL